MAGLIDFTSTLERNGMSGLRETSKKQDAVDKANKDLESAAKAAKKSAGMTGAGIGVSAGIAAGGIGGSLALGALAGGGIGLGLGLLAYELL